MKLSIITKSIGQFETLKIYGANAVAFLSTLTTVSDVLKIAALVASIAYTVVKTWKLLKEDNDIEHGGKKK